MSRFLQIALSAMASSWLLAGSPSVGVAQSWNGDLEGLPRSSDRPLEAIDGVKTYYNAVPVEPGIRLRVLISVPEEASVPLHPVLFTQWVSCDSIELGEGDGGAMGKVARESGLALVRVERAGTGDSEGPECKELDYETEVEHYVAAFTAILDHELIDARKVYLWGDSLGATTAPLVAVRLQDAGFDIEAIVVQGGGALTHFERMLMFDRFYLERRPDEVSLEAIHDEMIQRARFHTEYLIEQRHPDEVALDSPEMAAIRSDIRGLDRHSHYGRPFAWHQQAAQQNFLKAWAALDARVLVIFNEFDQFETLHGHRLIVDAVNRLRPGTARLISQPGLGHSSWRFSSVEEAYLDETGIPETATTGARIVHWLRTLEP